MKKNLGLLEELSEKMQGELNGLRDRLEEMEWAKRATDAKLEESKRKEEEAEARRKQEAESRNAEIKEVEERLTKKIEEAKDRRAEKEESGRIPRRRQKCIVIVD